MNDEDSITQSYALIMSLGECELHKKIEVQHRLLVQSNRLIFHLAQSKQVHQTVLRCHQLNDNDKNHRRHRGIETQVSNQLFLSELIAVRGCSRELKYH